MCSAQTGKQSLRICPFRLVWQLFICRVWTKKRCQLNYNLSLAERVDQLYLQVCFRMQIAHRLGWELMRCAPPFHPCFSRRFLQSTRYCEQGCEVTVHPCSILALQFHSQLHRHVLHWTFSNFPTRHVMQQAWNFSFLCECYCVGLNELEIVSWFLLFFPFLSCFKA